MAAGGAPSAWAQVEVRGALPSDLRDAIERTIGESERTAATRLELRRRAETAAEDAETVLRSEGFYAYQIEPRLTDDAARALVEIIPGPQFTIASPAIDWLSPAPAPEVQARGARAIELPDGAPGRAADVLAAEGRIVATVQEAGYADARAEPRRVIVDHAVRQVRPTFKIAAGDLVRLDGIEIARGSRTSARWLRSLAPWRSGDTYQPDAVAELERRLLDTGVYDSVTVALAPRARATTDGLRPVTVSLSERRPRRLELGASYSTTDGPGLDARWTRYNRLGRADTLQLLARLSNVESRLGANLTLPHWRAPQRTLNLGAEAYHSQTDAYDETGFGLRSDVTRRFGRTSYLTFGATLDYSRVEEPSSESLASLRRTLITATALATLSLDRSDDPLDPRQGWRTRLTAEPTYIGGDASLGFVALDAQGSAYLPFDAEGRMVAAGRLRVGSLLGGSLPDVPASRRFYAGGGGSVRGYGYQEIGERLPNGAPRGGLSLVEASLELRRKFTTRWGGVLFVDAGTVGGDQSPTFENVGVGVGLGVRYDLGFGPIRADIAYPVGDNAEGGVQIYLSIGQSF